MKKTYICMLLFLVTGFPIQAKSKALSTHVSNEGKHALAKVKSENYKDYVSLKTLASNQQEYAELSQIHFGYFTNVQKQTFKNYDLPKASYFQVNHNFENSQTSFKNKQLKGNIRIILKVSGKQPLPFHRVTLVNNQKQIIQEKKVTKKELQIFIMFR